MILTFLSLTLRWLTHIGEIEGKVAAIRMLLSFQGDSDGTAALLSQGLELLEKVKALVNEGRIGYRLFVAEKSSN